MDFFQKVSKRGEYACKEFKSNAEENEQINYILIFRTFSSLTSMLRERCKI